MSGLEDFQSSNGVQESSSDDNSSSSSSDSSSDSDSSSEEDTPDKLPEETSSENIEKSAAAAPAIELTEGIDLNGEDQNWSSSLDEILDNLTSSGPSSGSHQGPVDPVFVDHEDSQHATHMDSLVFDSQHNFAGDSRSSTMEDMNEPRLASVCNSTINSAENSIILGNDFDDGDIMFSDNNLENVLDGGGGAKVNVDDPQQGPSSNQSQGPNISNNAKSCPVSQKVRKKKRKTTQEDIVGSEEKKSKTDHGSNTKGAKVELGKNVSTVIEEAVSPNTSSSCSSPKEKGKLKLSLKDYKAKKEAEKNLRKKLENISTEVSLSSSSQGEDNPSLETSEEAKIEPDTNANIEDSANVVDMHNFDILDEVESDIEVSKGSNEDDEEDFMGDSEDSLAEEEVHQMLEANVKKKEAQVDIS